MFFQSLWGSIEPQFGHFWRPSSNWSLLKRVTWEIPKSHPDDVFHCKRGLNKGIILKDLVDAVACACIVKYRVSPPRLMPRLGDKRLTYPNTMFFTHHNGGRKNPFLDPMFPRCEIWPLMKVHLSWWFAVREFPKLANMTFLKLKFHAFRLVNSSQFELLNSWF